MHKKSLFNAQLLLERFFLSDVSMVQKSNYCKLFCVTLLLIASYTNAATYYSRVATGDFAAVSSDIIIGNFKNVEIFTKGFYYYQFASRTMKSDKLNGITFLFCKPNHSSLSCCFYCHNDSSCNLECTTAESVIVMPNPFIASGQSEILKRKTADPEVKIWLNFTHPEGIFKQLLIGYVPGATNGYEDSYDGTTLDANPYADFYSICDGKNLVIQGRSLPWTEDDVVVLGYRSAIVGTFAISIDHTEGNVENVNVFLHDKLLNVFHNLKRTPYVFATLQGTFKERFALKYIGNSLGTGDFEAGSNEVVVSVKNKTIKIASTSENLKNVFVYDISGKLLYEKNRIDTTSLAIESLPFGNQVLVVKVILDNNYETSRKIVF
ncbi:T9SS sorting signal type C domain-containing protein [Flavobacterium sp. Fl-77]|uniref:T9SS sorting signal type C domain-containing protein n=1 Tax=Flavobacterium flavipigmentatum TaxID=2893884 RepID=A0AAJ2VWQ5_9FLAO|nr:MULTISPECIES: T9SS sorting signal type C domain-containing protein [unclassified Flavobacterium]MDX6180809.1 T9SS sorting signal type C domain-containing protein [Flavobacterium sp. Fl-33]MDX6184409.1 T9SS sorting signal type C domain-containing protein [Flavobacterium sp. Fl-77]UFH39518.1 T9SS sorting signal type C domain-containing protein [Flavobacterium sp. F-70]